MFVNTISDWRKLRKKRNDLVNSFNETESKSFLAGDIPVLLKAVISKGNKASKHQLSNWLNTGFRIYAIQAGQLSKDDLAGIKEKIISDNELVRKLIVLGFDTLEVCGDDGLFGCRWRLKDYISPTQ